MHLNLSGEVPNWLTSLYPAAWWVGQAASRYMLGMVLFHILVRNLPPAVQNLWTSHYRDAQGN